jgi:hypothetical protein
MKIVNLNEYSEGDGMRNKLRQRVDQFEPELSDSLWDRIHHEMDQREANRKKRFLWWFSSVAVVVLTSGILTFILVNKTEQPVALQQQRVIVNTPVTTPNNTAENTAATANQSAHMPSATETNAVVSTNTTINTTSNGGNSQNGNNGVGSTPVTNPVKPNTQTPAVTLPTDGSADNTSEGSKDINPETPAQVIDPIVPEILPTEPAPAEVKNTEATDDKDKKEELVPAKAAGAKEPRQKFFIGVAYGYNQTFRTVSDVTNIIGLPTSAQKNTYESKGYSPTYGIEFGYLPIKNFFIKSGVSMYKTTETVKYSVYRRGPVFNQGGPGNPKDSVGAGNNITTQNTYTYIQIPLEVGYTTKVYNGLGIFVTGGVAYNVLNSYNYNYYESYWGRSMYSENNTNSKYFTNYLQLSGSAGAQYTIAKHWRASAGFTYRKAVTSASSTKETGVSTKPWSAGATAGLAFTF